MHFKILSIALPQRLRLSSARGIPHATSVEYIRTSSRDNGPLLVLVSHIYIRASSDASLVLAHRVPASRPPSTPFPRRSVSLSGPDTGDATVSNAFKFQLVSMMRCGAVQCATALSPAILRPRARALLAHRVERAAYARGSRRNPARVLTVCVCMRAAALCF